jgi:hypothetical protein
MKAWPILALCLFGITADAQVNKSNTEALELGLAAKTYCVLPQFPYKSDGKPDWERISKLLAGNEQAYRLYRSILKGIASEGFTIVDCVENRDAPVDNLVIFTFQQESVTEVKEAPTLFSGAKARGETKSVISLRRVELRSGNKMALVDGEKEPLYIAGQVCNLAAFSDAASCANAGKTLMNLRKQIAKARQKKSE